MEPQEEKEPITDTALDEIEDDEDDDRWRPPGESAGRRSRDHALGRNGNKR
ncbi:hypothetical protein [Paenibacillus thalictri]|uniref:hypothetical protein n=1 Tax=Paenibacillus thalictri TaxID=2527873 RepID=UPI0013EF335A|nr:hypothetical protein [Paenibacillus thalictri]